MSADFLITTIIVVLLPGTGMLYTLAVGLGQGWRASVAAAAGCTLGIVPAALASIVGLAAIFHTSALAYQLVRVAGVAYLLYMAWQIVREGGMLSVQPERTASGLLTTAVRGTLLNVLNPKLSLFFLAFLPQFVAPGSAGSTRQLIVLALVFMLVTFIGFVLMGAAASLARRHIIDNPRVLRWLRRTFAATFVMLGLRLATSEP